MNEICRSGPVLLEAGRDRASRFAHVGEPTVSGLVAQSLVEALEGLGVSRARFVDRAGLSAFELTCTAHRMPRSRLLQLCALASALSGVGALGLRWAESLRESSLFPVSNLVAHARSVREALTALHRYARLLSDSEPYVLVESDDEVALRLRPPPGTPIAVTHCLAEMIFATLVLHLRRTRMDGALKLARFAYRAPDHGHEYERTLGASVRFEARHSELVFDARRAGASRVAANDDMRTFLLATAEQLLRSREPRTATQVLQLLAWEDHPALVHMADVAATLGMSVRTLRRRLDAEDAPFPQVRAAANAIVAKRLLRDDALSLTNIAGRLGYTTVRGFYRAFRRWNGTTPGAYRRALAPRAPRSRDHAE